MVGSAATIILDNPNFAAELRRFVDVFEAAQERLLGECSSHVRRVEEALAMEANALAEARTALHRDRDAWEIERATEKSMLSKLNAEVVARLSNLGVQEARLRSVADGSDVLDLNVSGRPFSLRRSTLTQCEGSMLERLFSERWSENLQKQSDNSGRVFLDLDPDCFAVIAEWLQRRRTIIDGGAPAMPLAPSAPAGKAQLLSDMIDYLGLPIQRVDPFDVSMCGGRIGLFGADASSCEKLGEGDEVPGTGGVGESTVFGTSVVRAGAVAMWRVRLDRLCSTQPHLFNQGPMIGLIGVDRLAQSLDETRGQWPFVAHGVGGEPLGHGMGFLPLRGERRTRTTIEVDSGFVCCCGVEVALRLDMRERVLRIHRLSGSGGAAEAEFARMERLLDVEMEDWGDGDSLTFAGLDESGYRLAVSLSGDGNRVSVLGFFCRCVDS